MLARPSCPLVKKTIPQAIKTTTTVRIAVARLELTPEIPILAKIDVSAANKAEKMQKLSTSLNLLKSFVFFIFITFDSI